MSADSGDADKVRSPAPEVAYAAFVETNLKRNYRAHFADGMLSFTGFRLVSTPTFTPAFLLALTGSPTMVGVGISLLQAGAMLSPVFVAAAIDHRRRILPAALWIGLFMRLAILALALAGWLLSGSAAIFVSFAALILLGLGMGGQRVAFQTLLGKVIPIDRRGRLQGWRNFCGGVVAALLSIAAGRWLLGATPTSHDYAEIFLFTFALSSTGLLIIAMTMREPEAPTVRPRLGYRALLRDLPVHFADLRFRRFSIVVACSAIARAASPFYILHAGQVVGMDGQAIGMLALCFTGAETLFNLFWGRTGDLRGYRATFLLALLLGIVATLLLALSRDWIWTYLAFAGLGACYSGLSLSQQTMVLELGPRETLAMRLGLSSSIDGIVSSLGPGLAGLTALWCGYAPLFVVSASLFALALFPLARLGGVERPRR
ncbi:MFS transporter [Sphingomonas suaedae]|uniref:MFS transporter n=1 Tax=Sphingomonas suaedae TaxID=2599297 RepID=A0A518RIR1_9SPHN|nr:MFS transporter [Sphingomonas suaedae]QDX27356.1 MFS transporter [Sphingomonas suaedae]